jgi:hypothetical protein
MSSSERATTTERDEMRFSLRGLMLLMTAVAIVAGVLGASLQSVDSEGRAVLLAMWGLSAAIVVGRVGYCAMKRWRLIRAAGPTVYVLAPRGFFGSARSEWMAVLIGLICISLGVYYMTLMAANVSGPGMKMDPTDVGVFPSILSGLLISYGIGFVWWKRTVQLCDGGVVYGIRLLRWSHITKHIWDANAVVFSGVDQSRRDAELAAVVPADKLDVLQAFVTRKLKTAAPGWVGLQRMLVEGNEKTAPPLVAVDVSHKVTWRGLSSAFIAYILLGVIFAILFRPLGAPSREFMNGVFIAFAAMGAKSLYELWRCVDAGAPLVRVLLRFDWPSMIVASLIAVACFYISRQLGFSYPLALYALGGCAGLALGALGGMLVQDKLDLCENGVVLVRWPFLPWKRVCVLKWDRAGKSSLLLRSGWRRIRARVPKEHREFIDQVLRKKVGPGCATADSPPLVDACTQSK